MDFSLIKQNRTELTARKAESSRQYARLYKQLSVLQARLGMNDQVKELLDELQKREHQRAVGTYEKLLTSLLQDVLPGYREILLDLSTSRGLPSLDFFIRKSKGGELEDIYSGTGGSVTNIISMGLRVISVIRSGKRRLLLLDEPDCWLEESVIPKFVQVINQLAEKMNIQILMVTHTKEENLDVNNKVRLEKRANGLSATWAPTSDIPEWEDDQIGIRSIMLEDFQSHSCTYLPLAPGLTILSGQNDIGKSAIVSALRCVFLGEGNETVIAHKQNSARITVDFGPENILRWERHRTGKVLETFRHLMHDGTILESTDGAKQVPTWVAEKFKIGLIEGLDVQLSHQKEPVFLLNQPGTLRAKALAIGGEEGFIQSMMAIDKKEIADAKATIKAGEIQMEALNRVQYALQPLTVHQEKWDAIEQLYHDNENRTQQINQLKELEKRWGNTLQKDNTLQNLEQQSLLPIPHPQLDPELNRLASYWEKSQRMNTILQELDSTYLLPAPETLDPRLKSLESKWFTSVKMETVFEQFNVQPFISIPSLETNSEMLDIHGTWSKCHKKESILQHLAKQELPEIPQLKAAELHPLVIKWDNANHQENETSNHIKAIDSQLSELEEQEILCPTCGQEWHPDNLTH